MHLLSRFLRFTFFLSSFFGCRMSVFGVDIRERDSTFKSLLLIPSHTGEPPQDARAQNPISIFHLLILDIYSLSNGFIHLPFQVQRRKQKPIIQSERLAPCYKDSIEHERTFEIVTDKTVSWGIKGNWKIQRLAFVSDTQPKSAPGSFFTKQHYQMNRSRLRDGDERRYLCD